MDESCRAALTSMRRVVIKIGSRILVDSDRGGLREDWIGRLGDSIARLRSEGKEAIVVTSGAIGAGMAVLGYAGKPEVMAEKQACAAVGQIDLMHAYRGAFSRNGIAAAQILLTAEDFRDRNRYRNLQNALGALLDRGVVPIINENDSVATAEIRVGDNDKLSADVAMFLDADLLLVFTDEDGLFEANPKTHPEARLVEYVPEITEEVMALAGEPGQAGSAVSTGGMCSKLGAIGQVTRAGCAAFLANGFEVMPHEVLEGRARGTYFAGAPSRMRSRRRWLALAGSPRGALVVDEGGVRALRERHSSLLAVGIESVQGRFFKGDLVELRSASGEAVARGVTNYGSEKLKLVLRKRSDEARAILGEDAVDEVVPTYNMVLL